MQLKKLFFILALLGSMLLPAQAQFSGGTAYRIISGSSLPATCTAGPGVADVYVKTGGSPGIYYCSATNTWTLAAGGGGGGGITIGTTTITSGTNTRVLYNNAGVVGEYTITGTGNVVMSAAPTLTGRVSAADGLFATSVTTGTGSSAGLQVTADSLTTGNGTEISSSSVSSGNVVSIAATGTAAASNTKTALNVATSGANSTSTQTTYGAQISNTSTGTSSTNIALRLIANGGAQAHKQLVLTNGGTHSMEFESFAWNSRVAVEWRYSGGLRGFIVGAQNGGNTLIIGTGALNAASTTQLNLWANGETVPSLTIGGNPTLGFAVTGGGVPDTIIRRNGAAANLAFGAADAASPVAQTLSVQNVSTGTTDTAGVNWTRAASRGTGTGAGGSHVWQVAPAGSTGSSQNALVTALTLDSNRVLTQTRDSIGSTSSDGIVLQNTTAAAAGAQQYSPRIRLTGQGWKTNATAASQTVDWEIENVPVQGTANPTTNLVFSSQVNGGGYSGRLLISSGGQVLQNTASGSVSNGLGLGGDTTTGFWATGGYLGVDVSGTQVAGWRGSYQWFTAGKFITFGGSSGDVSIERSAANTIRIGQQNASTTAAGNLLVGTSSGAIGTSGAGVLAFSGSTAPSTSPTDTVQVYSGDAAAADHNLYARNEAGQINRLTGLAVRNSAQFDVTSSTTLATITGLTENVEAGRTYAFRAYVQTSAGAGGVKFAVGGTATATAISYEGELTSASDDNVVLIDRATALGTAVCDSSTTTSGTCKIEGVIQVNAAGTLVIQFAQSASNGTASSVLANQYLQLIPIS